MRQSFRRALSFGVLVSSCWLLVVSADAKIGAAYQMLLGNPSNATTDVAAKTNYLLVRDQYAISYNDTLGEPNWVSWNLTPADVGSSGRSSSFFEDPNLPTGYYRVQPSDYGDTGIDRGHMCPSADRTVSRADNDVVFYMSNMVPQASWNNQGVWNTFEQYCRSLASAGNELLITCGPSSFSGSRITSGKAAIPDYTWKIVVVVPDGTAPAIDRITTSTRVIAIKVPNYIGGTINTAADEWKKYLTSVNQIQQDTGFTFFTTLPTQTASVLRTMIDGQVLAGAPIISAGPQSQSVAAGSSVTFSVTATGDAPLSYQWTFEGQNIVGATSSSLTVNNAQLESMGNYRVIVTNNVSSATSDAALLVVTGIAPAILTEPVSQTVNAGENVTFTVLASGSPTMAYQWRKNAQPINGATSTTLTLANVQAADAASYDVVVTNSVNFATSTAASLTVTPRLPVIITQPAARSIGLNGTATFTVGVVGTEPFTYVWRKDGTPITGNASAATATLEIPNVSEASLGSYDVVITNSVDSTTSTAAALTISSFTNGALNYTGGAYTQNFDSLLNTAGYDSDSVVSISGNGPHQLTAAPFNATEMGAWWIVKYGGSGTNARFKVDDGTAFNGAIYSYGASGATERALGSLASGSTQSRFGMILNNNTGHTLTEFTITYTGEQWRDGSSSANTLAFAYSIDGTDINTGTFTAAPSLNFTSPIVGATETSLDGNLTANRRLISATVTGIVWPAGSRLLVRWTDTDDTNNDDGLAIDDFSFSAKDAGPVAPAVVSTTPAADATGIAPTSPISVTFNQAVNLAANWFTLTSTAQGALTATVTGGPTTYTLTPSAAFAVNDTITLDISAAKVTDQSTGTLTLAEDYIMSFATATPVAPSITTHPVSQNVAIGGSVTFSVTAAGTAPFTYQWRKDTQPINGATNATLTLTNVQSTDAGSYDVIVTNSVNSATSNAATLTPITVATNAITWNFTTNGAPSSTLPAGITGGTVTQGNNNGTTAFPDGIAASSGYTGASGTGNIGFAARTGVLSTASGGSAYATLTLTPDAGKRLLVTSLSFASRRSNTGPQAWALYSSADNYTTALATGVVTNASTWYLFTPTVSVNGALDTALTFRIYGYNGTGTASTNTANWRIDDLALTVAVQTAPVITSSPASVSVAAGADATFTVTATGTDPLSYQWRRNGEAILGATNASYTIVGVQATDAASYDVIVSNAAGSAPSSAATLTVLSGFSGWLQGNFNEAERADPQISGPNVVLTSDGLSNLMKYALGLNPRVPATSGLPASNASPTNWTYTFTRPASRDDIVYTVQASADLVDWDSISVTATKVSTVDGVDTWQAEYPIANASKLFFRLRVSTQPNTQ